MEPIPDRQSLMCPPSLKHSSRGPENGPIVPITGTRSQRGTQLVNQPPSASSTVSSWRSNASPLLPVSPRRSSHSPLLPLVTFPSASQVLGVQLLNPSNDESLEEVEFTDLGKFVGVEPSPDESVVTSPIQQGHIPTEDGQLSSIRPKSDLEPSWRRKAPLAPVEDQPSILPGVTPEAAAESPASRDADTALASPSTSNGLLCMASPAKPFAEGSFPSQALVVPPPLPPQRSPRALSYREPPISTFDDTMSRIKGAMQTNPQRNVLGTERHADRTPASSIAHTTEQPRLGRGISATARSHPPRIPEPDEPFTTVAELDDNIQRGQSSRIRLPPSRGLEPLSKKELANLRRSTPPLRWEVLSWDPPVEGMSIRDYSVNGVLFPKPPSQKGRPRFFVKLPPRGSYLIRRNSPATPKVHLPAKPLVNKTVAATGAFGRPRVADESSTWRRVLPPIPDQVESAASSEGLVTRSGSSPPDTDKPSNSTPTIETETAQPVQLPTKSRAEPKMPAGAGVAFYRESTSCPSVSFTVSSELEDVRQPETPAMPLPTEHTTPLPSENSKGNEVGGSNTLLTPREKTESKSSDGSVSTISTFSPWHIRLNWRS
jgi:serine/arginine repetitive matrix protein 2